MRIYPDDSVSLVLSVHLSMLCLRNQTLGLLENAFAQLLEAIMTISSSSRMSDDRNVNVGESWLMLGVVQLLQLAMGR